MDSVYEVSLLLDFYGQLLTDRQQEIMDLHYNNDYSLGEIAEQLEISRQGVYDNIKRGKAALNDFENKLGLIKRFLDQKSKAEEVLKHLNSLDASNFSSNDKEVLSKIESEVKGIIENI